MGDLHAWSKARKFQLKPTDKAYLRKLLRDGEHCGLRVELRFCCNGPIRAASRLFSEKFAQNASTIWRICQRYPTVICMPLIDPSTWPPRVFSQGQRKDIERLSPSRTPKCGQDATHWSFEVWQRRHSNKDMPMRSITTFRESCTADLRLPSFSFLEDHVWDEEAVARASKSCGITNESRASAAREVSGGDEKPTCKFWKGVSKQR